MLYYVETTNMAEISHTIERLKVEEIIVVNPLIEILETTAGVSFLVIYL